MKKLIPVLFLLISACSGEPENKTVSKDHKPALDSAAGKIMGLKKAREFKRVEIPYDTMLIPHEGLQDYFRFVLSNRFIVLGLNADTNLFTGDPQMVTMDFSPATITKNLIPGKIPDSLKVFIGKKFHMIGTNGEQFDATIKNLKALVQYHPGDGAMEYQFETYKSDTLAMARDAWSQGGPWSVMIVGEIDTVFTKDENIVGAVPAEMTTPSFFQPVSKPLLQTQVENDIRTTEQYLSIQKNYSNGDSTRTTWGDESGNEFFSCNSTSKSGFCSLSMSAGGYCGDEFYAELTSVWENRAGAKNKLLFCFPTYCSTTMIFDLEGDGIPEILAEDFSGCPALFKSINGRWTAVSYVYIIDMRCPC